MMKTSELRDKKIEDLQKLALEKQEELRDVTFAIKSAEESNLTKKKFLRREIARIMTVINEKSVLDNSATSPKASQKKSK